MPLKVLSPFHIKVQVTIDRRCATFAHGYFEGIPMHPIPTYLPRGFGINRHQGVCRNNLSGYHLQDYK